MVSAEDDTRCRIPNVSRVAADNPQLVALDQPVDAGRHAIEHGARWRCVGRKLRRLRTGCGALDEEAGRDEGQQASQAGTIMCSLLSATTGGPAIRYGSPIMTQLSMTIQPGTALGR
jgi:hypothetical protein